MIVSCHVIKISEKKLSRIYLLYKFFFSYILKLFYHIIFVDFERYIFINEREIKNRIIVIGVRNAQTIKYRNSILPLTRSHFMYAICVI